jgi:hypothetical protein
MKVPLNRVVPPLEVTASIEVDAVNVQFVAVIDPVALFNAGPAFSVQLLAMMTPAPMLETPASKVRPEPETTQLSRFI